ncbi:MAG: ABC transporter permease [Dehalococcoidia bacterium]
MAVAAPTMTQVYLPRRRNPLGAFVRKDPVGAVTGVVLLLIVAASLAAPVLAPYQPNVLGVDRLAPPNADHIMGTDQFGRDVFTRLLFGGRLSLGIGTLAALIGGTGSLLLALVFTYAGGWADYLYQRVVDTVLALPNFIVLLVLVQLLGPSAWTIAIVLGGRLAIVSSRVIRSGILSVKSQDYLFSAAAMGAGPWRMMFRHVVPNVLSLVIVNVSSQIGFLIIAEAALSFLGLGVLPPTPTWGGMMGVDGRRFIIQAPWMLIPPAAVLTTVVLCANIFGDAVRDALDPRVR